VGEKRGTKGGYETKSFKEGRKGSDATESKREKGRFRVMKGKSGKTTVY